MKHNVDITVYEHDYASVHLDGSAKDVLSFVQSKVDLVPEEFKDGAYVSIKEALEYGEPCIRMTIGYIRPETDEEQEVRNEREVEAAKEKQSQEAALYEKLRVKFGDKDDQ